MPWREVNMTWLWISYLGFGKPPWRNPQSSTPDSRLFLYSSLSRTLALQVQVFRTGASPFFCGVQCDLIWPICRFKGLPLYHPQLQSPGTSFATPVPSFKTMGWYYTAEHWSCNFHNYRYYNQAIHVALKALSVQWRGSVITLMRVPIKTKGVCALMILLDWGRIISVLVVLTSSFSLRTSSIPQFE